MTEPYRGSSPFRIGASSASTDIAAATWAQKSTVLYYPIGLGYLSMPVGMALCLVFHLTNAYLDATRRGVAVAELTHHDEDSREGLG